MPNMPYREITFTMPDVLWPIFRDNRALLRGLSVLGAKAIQCWIDAEHGTKVFVTVVAHTSGRNLNFNPHLHILASAGGLREIDPAWIKRLEIRKASMAAIWRDCMVNHLQLALRHGKLRTPMSQSQLEQVLSSVEQRAWHTHHKDFENKTHFLRHAARYLRRPPVVQYELVPSSPDEVGHS